MDNIYKMSICGRPILYGTFDRLKRDTISHRVKQMTTYNGVNYDNDNEMVDYVKNDGSIEVVTAKVAHGREAASKYTEIRANAKNIIRDFIANDSAFTDLDDVVKESIKVLANAMSGKRSGGSGSALMNLFRAESTVSKMDLFEKFELGTPAMQTKARTWAKNGSLFVRETEDKKSWEAFSEMPEDWAGAKPAETVAL